MRRALALGAVVLTACQFEVSGLPLSGGDAGATPDLAVAADGAAAPDGAAPADLGAPTSLTGRLVTVGTRIDLSAEGRVDWAHWGRAAATDFDHRAAGATRISNITRLGPGLTLNRYANDPRTFAWNDGAPTANEPGTPTGIYIPGGTAGLRFTAACDGAARTLRVYLTGWRSSATFGARLSDGSQTYMDPNGGNANADYRPVYELAYRCPAPLTVEVTWSVSHDYGGCNVGIAAATLQ